MSVIEKVVVSWYGIRIQQSTSRAAFSTGSLGLPAPLPFPRSLDPGTARHAQKCARVGLGHGLVQTIRSRVPAATSARRGLQHRLGYNFLYPVPPFAV